MLSTIDKALRTVVDKLALAVGWILLGLAAVTSIETLLRKFFQISVQGIDEYGGYVLAVISGVGFTYALLLRGHIRIDAVVRLLPRQWRSCSDIVAIITLGFYAFMMMIATVWLVAESWQLDARAVSPLQTPLIWPQGFWLACLVLFVFSCAIIAMRALIAATRRDWDGVARAAGIPDIDEEVSAEISAVRQRLDQHTPP